VFLRKGGARGGGFPVQVGYGNWRESVGERSERGWAACGSQGARTEAREGRVFPAEVRPGSGR